MNDKKLFTFEEIKQKLVNYCVYQDRSHFEVEQKMKEYVLIKEAKEEILLYLIKENYLNEERFARSYTRGKFYLKKWGKNKIKIHLLQKGISEKLIQKSFAEISDKDYEAELSKQYKSYFSKQKSLAHYQKNSKTIRYLLSRGFDYDDILIISNQFSNSDL